MAAQRGGHALCQRRLRAFQAGQVCAIAKTRAHLFGFEIEQARQRMNVAGMIEQDKRAAITLGEKQAFVFEAARKGARAIGLLPRCLDGMTQFARIGAFALGLLPFGEREVERIALAHLFDAARHLPALFEIEFARNPHQLRFEERELFRGHGVGVDARPHAVGMPAAFLFMEDERARLAFEAEAFFDAVDGFAESIDGDVCLRRWRQAQREEILAAARAFGGRFRFPERALEVVGGEPAQFVQIDMFVVVGAHQVDGQALAAAALGGFEDHGPVSRMPSARKSSVRIERTARIVSRKSSSVSGVIGSVPILAAWASWLRLLAICERPSSASACASAWRSSTAKPVLRRAMGSPPSALALM